MSSSVIPTGTMPVMPFKPEHDVDNDEWLVGTTPESHSALQSHFSVDSCAYQVDADASELDSPFSRVAQSWQSTERFSNRPDGSTRVADFAIVPTRPPLRPTVSFGNVLAYSYYSSATDELEQKSQVLAVEEESQRNASHCRLYECIAILCALNFLCGMNITSLATALPTLAYDLSMPAVQSFWLVNGYLLSSTIIQPLSTRLSAAVGSRVVLSIGLLLWTAGSITSAVAGSTAVLLAGRAITGLGGGTVSVVIPLAHRQLQRRYNHSDRAVSLSFWLGTFTGAVAGGALAQPSTWRYIFYLNLPICLLALFGLPFLLRLPASDGYSYKNALRLDYIGWLLLSGSITCISLAVGWTGMDYSWTSMQTLLPLITGTVCFVSWILRSLYAQDPIIPVSLLRKATGLVSCLSTMIHGMVFIGLIYFTPFLHSVGGHLNPTVSALTLSPYTLALAVVSLSGGITTASFHRWSTWVSWAFVTTGVGLLLLVKEGTIRSVSVSISLVVGMALGSLAGSLSATIQSTATNDDETIHAAPLSVFFSTLGNTMGLAIGSCIFLNRLGETMHSNQYLAGNADMYTLDAVRMAYVTQHMPSDRPGLKANLVDAYLDALRWVWVALCALAGLALLLSTYGLVDRRIDRSKIHDENEKQSSYTH